MSEHKGIIISTLGLATSKDHGGASQRTQVGRTPCRETQVGQQRLGPTDVYSEGDQRCRPTLSSSSQPC